MQLATINTDGHNGHDVTVHKAGCRDIKKDANPRNWFPLEVWVEEFESKRELWLNYNADFLAEGSGAWQIHFMACTAGLPDGGTFNTETDED